MRKTGFLLCRSTAFHPWPYDPEAMYASTTNLLFTMAPTSGSVPLGQVHSPDGSCAALLHSGASMMGVPPSLARTYCAGTLGTMKRCMGGLTSSSSCCKCRCGGRLRSSGCSTPNSSSSSVATQTSSWLSSCGLMAWRYVATSPTMTRVTASMRKPASPSTGPQPFSNDRRRRSMDVMTSSCPNPCRRRLATM